MIVVLPEGTDRRTLTAALEAAGVRTGVHFPHCTTSAGSRTTPSRPRRHPCRGRHGPRVLSLPLHPMLTADEVDTVCAALAEALG